MHTQIDLSDALALIRRSAPAISPRVGLILGSGLGSLADRIEHAIVIPYKDIPGFPVSRVSGHAGNLVLGTLSGVDVVAMQGRAHLYEGWSPSQATMPLRCMHALGIHTVLVSNASGGINLRYSSGQVVLIDSHIDLMNRNGILPEEALASSAAYGIPNRSLQAYDRSLRTLAHSCAIELGFSLESGTYLATLGPNYETRAEYRAFSKLGADMVGMSTVPEVIVANQLGLRVLAFSIVTNVANPDVQSKTDHNEVLDWSKQAQKRLVPLILRIVKSIEDVPKPSTR